MSRVAYLWVALLVGLVCQPSNGNVLNQELEEKDMNQGKQDADDVRAEILSLTEQMKKTVEENDPAALANLYDEDVIFMGNGHPTLEGLEKLKLYLGWMAYTATITINTEQIDLLDSDHVLQRGKLDAIGVDGSVTVDGKILLLWKKTDKGWKIAMQMYNQDSK